MNEFTDPQTMAEIYVDMVTKDSMSLETQTPGAVIYMHFWFSRRIPWKDWEGYKCNSQLHLDI